MTSTELETVVRMVASLPLTAILILVLVGGYRGWWIYGTHHEKLVTKLEKDRDEWRTLALEVSGLAHSVVRRLDTDAGGAS
jgi:hypothetical protein